MKMLYRDAETELLRRQRWLSKEQFSRFTLVGGRHLSGKTTLIAEAYSDEPFLYFRIGGRCDILQMEEAMAQCRNILGADVVMPATGDFAALLDSLYGLSVERALTVVIEGFDELVRKSSDRGERLKKIIRGRRRSTRLNLVVTLYNQAAEEAIFHAPDAPLHNCLDMKIGLSFLKISEMKALLDSTGAEWKNIDLLTLYMLTGGCQKLVTAALSEKATSRSGMLDYFLRKDSPLAETGRMRVDSALGHNREVYISLLQLVSQGCTTLGSMQDALGKIIVGGHLAKLEEDYGFLKKTRPVLADRKERNVVRYIFADQYMDFWFRYIESYRDYAERDCFAFIRSVIENDAAYTKKVLTSYFRQLFCEENGIGEIGGDWRSGKEKTFELDVVGLDAKAGRALVADVETDPSLFDKDSFLGRIIALRRKALKGYFVDSRLLTLNDM